jgi:hypothetical protein
MTDIEQAPADLDGPVAAPNHHRLAFENERIRVVETVIRAGDTAPLHTHLLPHVLIVSSGSRFIRRDANGAVLLDTRDFGPDHTLPAYAWNDGIGPHTLENIGPDDIVATAIELKG